MQPTTTEHYSIYEAIVDATQSEVILFFVIVAVVMAVVVAPLYLAVLRDKKAARLHEREDRQQLIDVVSKNSAVIASLQVTLDGNGVSQVEALKRVHERLDKQGDAIRETTASIAQINTKFDNSLGNQTEMLSKVNKIFVMASGGSLTPESKGG